MQVERHEMTLRTLNSREHSKTLLFMIRLSRKSDAGSFMFLKRPPTPAAKCRTWVGWYFSKISLVSFSDLHKLASNSFSDFVRKITVLWTKENPLFIGEPSKLTRFILHNPSDSLANKTASTSNKDDSLLQVHIGHSFSRRSPLHNNTQGSWYKGKRTNENNMNIYEDIINKLLALVIFRCLDIERIQNFLILLMNAVLFFFVSFLVFRRKPLQ